MERDTSNTADNAQDAAENVAHRVGCRSSACRKCRKKRR